MSAPAGKRRRLNDNNVLFKPFKSPMKLPSNEDPKDAEPAETKPLEARTLTTRPVLDRTTTPKWNLPEARTIPHDRNHTDLSSSEKTEFAALRRAESQLSSTLKALRTELDQVKQAQRIEASNRDSELESLITLWRSASQQAAEDVYATVREKVNAVGGMKRWREMERERKERMDSGFGVWDEGEVRRDGDQVDGEEHEDYERQREEEREEERLQIEREEERQEEALQQQTNTVDEAETFSMDVMLDYLGIKAEVIGFDVDGQRWIS